LDGEVGGGFNPPSIMLTWQSSSIESMCSNRDWKINENINDSRTAAASWQQLIQRDQNFVLF